MKLPIDGAEHAIISDEILNLPSLPKKLAVIGGGYIGLEFAGIYNNYGSEVHVVYRQVSPVHRFIQPLIYSIIHLVGGWVICSCVCSLFSLLHACVHSNVLTFIHPFVKYKACPRIHTVPSYTAYAYGSCQGPFSQAFV